MPALACNRPRRVIAALVFLMVMRFLRVSTFAPGYFFCPFVTAYPSWRSIHHEADRAST